MPGNRLPRWWPAVRAGLLGAAAGAVAGPVAADLIDRGNRAWLRRDAELAEYVYGREVARQTRRRGPDHPRTLEARVYYAAALYGQGRLEEADAQLADVIIRCGPAGDDDALLLAARAWRARVLYDLGSYDDAERQSQIDVMMPPADRRHRWPQAYPSGPLHGLFAVFQFNGNRHLMLSDIRRAERQPIVITICTHVISD